VRYQTALTPVVFYYAGRGATIFSLPAHLQKPLVQQFEILQKLFEICNKFFLSTTSLLALDSWGVCPNWVCGAFTIVKPSHRGNCELTDYLHIFGGNNVDYRVAWLALIVEF